MLLIITIIFFIIPFSNGVLPEKTKYILLYTSLGRPLPNWHLKTNVGDQKYFERLECPAANCVVTSNRTYLPNIKDYDAIGFNSWNIESFPPSETRSLEQIYFVYLHESPSRTKQDLSAYKNTFNWTMSYVLNADVVVPYSWILDKELNKIVAPAQNPHWRTPTADTSILTNEFVKSVVRGKTKMAAWMVSSCYSPSQRKFVVRKMQEYIPVDIYGKCGVLSCEKSRGTDCRKIIERDYYFYLSFENSLCQDYVTEKVFEMMKRNVIPVVFGGADYNRFLPPGSYINALDFESIEDLTSYMRYIASDLEEYMKFFWWKDFYTPIQSLNFCPLCEKMAQKDNENVQISQSYLNVDHWFKNGTCLNPETIPFIREPLIQYNRIKT